MLLPGIHSYKQKNGYNYCAYYIAQALFCFTTKRDFQETIARELTSPSQQIANASFFEEVLEGIKNLAAGI